MLALLFYINYEECKIVSVSKLTETAHRFILTMRNVKLKSSGATYTGDLVLY